MNLGAHIDIEHGEDEIERVLIESLRILHFRQFLLEALHVWNALKVSLQLMHGKINILFLECLPELGGKAKLHVPTFNARVERKKSTGKSDAHLLIGNR